MNCLILGLLIIFSVYEQSQSEDVRLLDLEPPEAQQIIDQQDTSLKYAPLVESNVPGVRFIDNETQNVVEDIYLANQYHGQDGLGGYVYGYSVPDIAKSERKRPDGDLKGAYQYIGGNGKEIKVEYWDDGTGFHQIDNVDRTQPEANEDTPEVRAAKDAFAKKWQEEAERNSHPIANPFDKDGNYASGPLSPQGQLQRQQQLAQQPKFVGVVQSPQAQYNQGQQHPQAKYGGVQAIQSPRGQYQQGQQQPQAKYGGAQVKQSPQGQYQQGQQQPQAKYAGAQAIQSPQGQYQQGQQPQVKYGGAQVSQSSQYKQGQQAQYGGAQVQNKNFPATGKNSQQAYQQSASQYQSQQRPAQDVNDVYSGQYSENRNAYAQSKPQIGNQQNQNQVQSHQAQSYQAQANQPQGYQSQGQSYQGHGSQTNQAQITNGNQYDGEDDGEYHPSDEGEYVPGEDEGPPKGFFYKFDYPAGLIVGREDRHLKGNVMDIYEGNKAQYDAQLKGQQGQGGAYAAHH